jgi:hypothetical protein
MEHQAPCTIHRLLAPMLSHHTLHSCFIQPQGPRTPQTLTTCNMLAAPSLRLNTLSKSRTLLSSIKGCANTPRSPPPPSYMANKAQVLVYMCSGLMNSGPCIESPFLYCLPLSRLSVLFDPPTILLSHQSNMLSELRSHPSRLLVGPHLTFPCA